MDNKPPPHLGQAATALAGIIAQDRVRTETRIAELDRLIHDAEARERRRAAHNRRDRDTYRLGGAFEPVGGLNLDPVTLSGWLAAGPIGVLLLTRVMQTRSNGSIVEALSDLFQTPIGGKLRDLGVWVRWQFLRDLYVEVVEKVAASPFGKDPNHAARRKPPTTKQTYMVAEICRLLQIEPKAFATLGSAYEWLADQGGNPRFQVEPTLPSLADLAGAQL